MGEEEARNEMSASFRARFPQVESAAIEVRIHRGGPLDERPQLRAYTADSVTLEPVRCTNPQCAGGGWPLWDVLAGVVAKKETSVSRVGVCKGSERMNRSASRDCLALFRATITISYE